MLKEVVGSERGENGDGHARAFRDKEKFGIGDRKI